MSGATLLGPDPGKYPSVPISHKTERQRGQYTCYPTSTDPESAGVGGLIANQKGL